MLIASAVGLEQTLRIDCFRRVHRSRRSSIYLNVGRWELGAQRMARGRSILGVKSSRTADVFTMSRFDKAMHVGSDAQRSRSCFQLSQSSLSQDDKDALAQYDVSMVIDRASVTPPDDSSGRNACAVTKGLSRVCSDLSKLSICLSARIKQLQCLLKCVLCWRVLSACLMT